MKNKDAVSSRLHDVDCQCRSCLMLSAVSRASFVVALLVVLWAAVFWSMGWI